VENYGGIFLSGVRIISEKSETQTIALLINVANLGSLHEMVDLL
jgi:hypothetical protein